MNPENKHTPESLAHLLQRIAKRLCWGRPVEICTEQQQSVHEALTESARLLHSHASLVAENKRLREALAHAVNRLKSLNRYVSDDGQTMHCINRGQSALNPEGTT